MGTASATQKFLDPSTPGPVAAELKDLLQKWVIGQPTAIEEVVDAYQIYASGLSSQNRPIVTFLFLGPTGTGKTKMVEALGQALYSKQTSVLKIDCAEFQHSHEIAKLLGSPPGYLGHRETQPLLSQNALDACHTPETKVSLVLFDEVEKASDALWNLLLGILDKGVLTLGDNRKVDFTHSMIFMTSNLGAKEVEALSGPHMGFASTQGTVSAESVGLAAARRKFTPEFMNRIDKVVTFSALSESSLEKILHLELDAVQQRCAMAAISAKHKDTPRFMFCLSKPARQLLLEEGTDAKYGARQLKRAIEKHLVLPLASLITSGQLRPGDLLRVGREGSKLTFRREDSRLAN